MSMPLPFDQTAVRAAFDTATFQRGVRYAASGAVHGLEVQAGGRELHARVRGSQRRPYEVEVTIAATRRQPIVSYCTCPVTVQCKHGVAVLLAALHAKAVAEPAPRRTAPPADPLAGPVGAWLAQLQAVAGTVEPGAGPGPEQALYLLRLRNVGERVVPELALRVARRLKSGGWGAERESAATNLATGTARYVRPEDRLIGRLLTASPNGAPPGTLPDAPDTIDLLLERVLATGRCHWTSKDGPLLQLGPERPGTVRWVLDRQGTQRPIVVAETAGLVPIPAASPWYVDPDAGLAGRLGFSWPRPALAALLQAPPIEPAQVPLVRAWLHDKLGDLPAPIADVVEEVRKLPPRPTLTLVSERPWDWDHASLRDLVLLRFDYDGMLVAPDEPQRSLRRAEGDRVVVVARRAKAERAAERRLRALGLEHAPVLAGWREPGAGKPFTLPDGQDADWWRLVHEGLPALRAEGWSIVVAAGFRHQVIEATEDWEASLGAAGAWFSLELGIMVDGRRIPLLPVLAEALRHLGHDAGEPAMLAPGGTLYARLEDGRVLALPADRIRPMLATLVELFDARALSAEGTLQVSLGQALALSEPEAALRLRWLGTERIAELARRLRGLDAIGEAEPPPGLRADLRPYQRHGLAWLQFIAGLGLGGILADDMGLGKTIQTLAHVLAEKQAGRLDDPALVVCPTSLVPNWRHEAQRFAPELTLLTLHGPDRKQRFDAIADADLVLTTYALLPRDAATLLSRPWHVVVLDEAQTIKNPASRTAQLTAKLDAHHRLCLTGTPIENHLGELWSQLDFLVPGLLGDRRRFARVFRTPIEKHGDDARRDLLRRRIRPFLLRRTKSEVEAELPDKIEILRHVELTGEQRDLYETVRLAMHERVRQAIAAKGFARSRIVILDALLKLRQVCCDPRLVKLAAAERATSSAKLAHLMEMLPALIEDGRRVLLFSQFTSMLDLMRPAIEAAGLPFVELRGDTADRATPVASFQAGRAPLFLISLKAGGTGLNLTAADTVILYDPWWNPAVEAQAMDRAHRIGQDKLVFVYKLIAEGTIEERMLELQERKRALAAGVLGAAGGGRAAFDEDDLRALFQPLR